MRIGCIRRKTFTKANELLNLCDELEEKLTQKEATAERLVGAVVNEIS